MPQISSETTPIIFDHLHELSRQWHIVGEDLTDFENRVEFSLGIWKRYFSDHSKQTWRVSTEPSLSLIISRAQFWRRWVSTYTRRTNIRMNLFFNLANQGDSRINIDIARTSKAIAEETKRDSSSMITIAAVTMLFLPGTFVSVCPVVFSSP